MKIKLTTQQKQILINEILSDYPEFINKIQKGSFVENYWLVDLSDDDIVEITHLCVQAVARSQDEEGKLTDNGQVYDDIGQIFAIGEDSKIN